MALVTVREKGAAPDAPTTQVDESWLDRWPDDFVRVDDTAPAAAPAEEQPRRRGSDF